jgi:hypothetical protein
MGKEFGENQRWISEQTRKDNLVPSARKLIVEHQGAFSVSY